MIHLDRRSFLQSSALMLVAGKSSWSWSAESGGAEDSSAPQFAERPDFKPQALFLTWRQDPTSTMTIQWVGPENADAERSVWYRERTANIWQRQAQGKRPLPLSDLYAFRAELTGLKADTEYEFHIGLDSARERFRTMPNKEPGDFEFVSGGDSGVGSSAERTNQLVARRSPRFVVMGGDLAYENGASAEVFLKFLNNYSRDLRDAAGRLIPMLACIGNHEVKGGNGQTREKAPFFYTFFDGLYPEAGYASLEFGDYLSLVFLDSNHTTPVEGEQTAWLEETLREREDFPNLFVHYHVPAYPSVRAFDGGASPKIRQHWVPLLERYNVDAVMEHHDHAFKRTHALLDGLKNERGLSYLGDGSWGKLRPVKSPDKDHPYLAVAQEAYHFSLHRLEGKSRSHLAISDADKIVDRFETKKRARSRSK